MSYPKKIRYEICGKTFWAKVYTANETWRLTQLVKEEGEFAKSLIKSFPGKKFLDIGAAIGGYAIPASRLCSKVLAVEPDPLFSSHLEENIPSEMILKACISNKDGTVELLSSGKNTFSPRLKGSPGNHITKTSVPCFSYPTLVHKFFIPDIIKIDIEGAEALCIPDILKTTPGVSIWLELHPDLLPLYNTSLENILSLLQSHYGSPAYYQTKNKEILTLWKHGTL